MSPNAFIGTDGGGLTETATANSVALHAVWADAPDDAWAVGDVGTIVHFNGTMWTPVSSPTSLTLYAIWGSGPMDVWAVGEQGVILHYP
jgi:photosystem II stability/assembly factor-like uncharacterized protein